jgi:hypothetical protein
MTLGPWRCGSAQARPRVLLADDLRPAGVQTRTHRAAAGGASPAQYRMCSTRTSALWSAIAPTHDCADLVRRGSLPSIVRERFLGGLPDAERGTTGTPNRQPSLLTAACRGWQARFAAPRAGGYPLELTDRDPSAPIERAMPRDSRGSAYQCRRAATRRLCDRGHTGVRPRHGIVACAVVSVIAERWGQ